MTRDSLRARWVRSGMVKYHEQHFTESLSLQM